MTSWSCRPRRRRATESTLRPRSRRPALSPAASSPRLEESERRWIGWERKRGKLHELNRLLRGRDDTTFIARRRGRAIAPQGVRYVVTLDSDTRLPRDTIRG